MRSVAISASCMRMYKQKSGTSKSPTIWGVYIVVIGLARLAQFPSAAGNGFTRRARVWLICKKLLLSAMSPSGEQKEKGGLRLAQCFIHSFGSRSVFLFFFCTHFSLRNKTKVQTAFGLFPYVFTLGGSWLGVGSFSFFWCYHPLPTFKVKEVQAITPLLEMVLTRWVVLHAKCRMFA